MKRNKLIFTLCITAYICSCKKEPIQKTDSDPKIGSQYTSLRTTADPIPWTQEVLFDGTLDLNNVWHSGVPWGFAPYLNECSNNRTCVLPQNLSVVNNELKIKADNGPFSAVANDANLYSYDYSRGQLYSQNSYRYGYFEIRAKAQSGQGVGAAFWLFGGNQGVVDEIDIFELKGWEPTVYPTNYHRAGYARNYPQEILSSNIPGTPNFAATYNTFGLEWTSNKMTWYINDAPVRTVTSDIPDQWTHVILDVNCPYAGTCPNGQTIFPNYFNISNAAYYNVRPVNASFISTSNSGGTLTPIKDYTKWNKKWTHTIPGDFDNDNITDVLLYNKNTGESHFYNSSGLGQSFTGWRTTWDLIVPGNFDGSGNTDLLFYDSNAGEAYIFSVGSNTGLSSTIKSFSGWRSTWSSMIPGDFDNDNITDVLLYDKINGESHFYNSSGLGQSFTGWRKTWEIMVPGEFNGSGNTDLLFYDSNGDAYFFGVNSNSGLFTIQSYNNWRTTWDLMVPGDFDNDNITDILLYDKTNGFAQFRNSGGSSPSYSDWQKSWNQIVPGNFDNVNKTDILLYDSY